MVGGDNAEDVQVCSTSIGGGPAGGIWIWAAALFRGGVDDGVVRLWGQEEDNL